MSAAFSGMIAAQLACRGFQGPASIVEARDGFLHAYSDKADPGKVLEGIGSGFEILRASVKPHACCRYMQPPIDGVLRIVMENNLQPGQVEKVRLGLLRAGAQPIAEPIENKYCPHLVVDASQHVLWCGRCSSLPECGSRRVSTIEDSLIRSETGDETG